MSAKRKTLARSKCLGLQQLYIVPNTEKGIVEWKETVTDEQYSVDKNNLKK